MGAEPSEAAMPNQDALFIYNEFASIGDEVLQMEKKRSSEIKRFIEEIHSQCSKISAGEKEYALNLGFPFFGPVFFRFFAPVFDFHPKITEISFYNSGLDESYVHDITNFLSIAVKLKKINFSHNPFGDSASLIFDTLTTHPTVTSIDMSYCDINESCFDSLFNLISSNTHLLNIIFYPADISAVSETQLTYLIQDNAFLQNVSISDSLNERIKPFLARNLTINSILYTLVCPWIRPPSYYFSIPSPHSPSSQDDEDNSEYNYSEENVQNDSDQQILPSDRNSFPKFNNNLPLRYGKFETIGRRPQMQDSVSIIESPDGLSLFSLFDGHGSSAASSYAAENLPPQLLSRIRIGIPPEEAINTTFAALEADMKGWCRTFGTTAVVALLDTTTMSLSVGNCGDSRIVLGTSSHLDSEKFGIEPTENDSNGKQYLRSVRLSFDHKPYTEMKYIESQGGSVFNGRINGSLAVGRAFGDSFLGKAIRATPFIRSVQLKKEDRVLIIACDGLWDVITDMDAVEFALTFQNPARAAEELVKKALALGSTDNISVIVIFLNIC